MICLLQTPEGLEQVVFRPELCIYALAGICPTALIGKRYLISLADADYICRLVFVKVRVAFCAAI